MNQSAIMQKILRGILNNGQRNKNIQEREWSLLPQTLSPTNRFTNQVPPCSEGGYRILFLAGLASRQVGDADITRRHCITCNDPPPLHTACKMKHVSTTRSISFPCVLGPQWRGDKFQKVTKILIRSMTPRLPARTTYCQQ